MFETYQKSLIFASEASNINFQTKPLWWIVFDPCKFFQSAPPPVPCNNAASTSIISGAKAVDFAAFAIGIMTLVININNNIVRTQFQIL